MTPAPFVYCLIVADLDENLLALAALLAEPGVKVLQARSGAEALELLLAHPVALALLDVQMPEMDGFELAELMRGSERTREVPIIFVTAGAGDRHRVFKGYELGAVDFLQKPIEPHVLKSKALVFFQLQRQKLQLAAALHERTETLRMNEVFTTILGHDLRGPLSAILMSAMVLEKRSHDELVRTSALRVTNSAKSMRRMIDDLLDLTRARLGGGIAVRRDAADLEVPIARAVEECIAAHPDHPIEWQPAGHFSGQWDADRLAQAAGYLLGNAMRHGTAGEPVVARLDGTSAAHVTFSVANGGRIEAELLPRIFDPFRGREERNARAAGLGIGLYIVQQIAIAHGGTIDVVSGVDNRTVFTLCLPRHAGPAHGLLTG